MNLKMLKAFKKGDEVSCGCLFPTIEPNEDIRWTAISVVDGTRTVGASKTAPSKSTSFRFVEFALDYLGVDMGAVRAVEGEKGEVQWESVR